MTNYIEPLFDPELLNKSNEEKLQYFEDYKVPHFHLTNIHNEIIQAVNKSKKIILVIGPAGIGKTTLYNGCYKKFSEIYASDKNHPLGSIPILQYDLTSSLTKNFVWKIFFCEILKTLKYTFIKDQSAAELAPILETAINQRNLRIVLFNEGQHFAKARSIEDKETTMDFLKSLTNKTNATYIMFGTWQLLDFADLHGQLSRRVQIINFPRYQVSELNEFRKIILTFLSHFPVKYVPASLINDIEYFYTRTLGCVGLLKDWLYDALVEILYSQKQELTLDILNKTAYKTEQLKVFWKEIKLIEKSMNKMNSPKNFDALVQEIMYSKEEDSNDETTTSQKSNQKSSKSPIGRKSIRDPVGDIENKDINEQAG